MTTRSKLLLLGSLYFSQGLPYGFFSVALPVLLREQGLSLPAIGLSGLLFLPWALKFLWAPLVDRVHAPRWGRRRAVIVPLQLGSALVLVALSTLGSAQNTLPLFVGVLLINLFSATQDIATDGLAVEVLDVNERGLGNGLQVGAYRVGMIVGGGLMLWVFARAGWRAAYLGLAGLLLLASLQILLSREANASGAPDAHHDGATLRSLFRPGMLRWGLVLIAYKMGEWFATGMLKTFLADAGQSIEQIGLMLGTVGSLAGLCGAMLGGALTPRLGRRNALLLFGAIQTAGVCSFAVATWVPTQSVFYAVTVIEHVVSGLATAALFTAMMDCCRPHREGTDYTAQACLVVVASGVAQSLSGFSAGALGYSGHFLLAGALCSLGVIAVAFYKPSHPDFALLPGGVPIPSGVVA